MASQPVRVLMLTENNPYPFDRRVRCEADTLTGAGYQVTVVCPGERGQLGHEVICGVAVYRFPAPGAGHGVVGYAREYVYATAMLLAYTLYLLLRYGFDVVHVFNPPDTLCVIGLLTRLLGKKFVYDHRDPSPDLYASKFGSDRGLIYAALVWLEGVCCRHANLILAPNVYCRELEVSRHGVPLDRTVVVHNGPKLDEFVRASADLALCVGALTTIAYVGHISSQDGVDYLLHSLRHLKYELARHDFFCVIVGPADDADGLHRLAGELGISDHVRFTGKVPFGAKLLAYLSAADICVEPAPASPLNNIATFVKLMEYMAMSKPIVAYDLRGNRFVADASALYARPNDTGDFAQKLAQLMAAPDMRQDMGRRGQMRVRDRFAWEKSAETLLHAYQRLTRDVPRQGLPAGAEHQGQLARTREID